MTREEFSAEFDLLYNNIMSNIAPGLTEYEKSVFLTQAQEQIITDIYSGQYKGEPFENSEEVRVYLKSLIQTAVKTDLVKFDSELPDNYQYHYKVKLDAPNLWFVVLESVIFSEGCPCTKGKKVVVKPVTYDTYWSISRNPFKGPNQNRVLKVTRSKNLIELISEYGIDKYLLKYISRPVPIILQDLIDASINGKINASGCDLPNVLHRAILVRAVQIAKSVWGETQAQQ